MSKVWHGLAVPHSFLYKLNRKEDIFTLRDKLKQQF